MFDAGDIEIAQCRRDRLGGRPCKRVVGEGSLGWVNVEYSDGYRELLAIPVKKGRGNHGGKKQDEQYSHQYETEVSLPAVLSEVFSREQ